MSNAMHDVRPSVGVTAADARFAARLRKRYAAERRFRLLGLAAILFSALMLAVLLFTMTSNAIGGFQRTELRFPVDLSQSGIDASTVTTGGIRGLESAGLPAALQASAAQTVGPVAAGELSDDAWRQVAKMLVADPAKVARRFEVSVP